MTRRLPVALALLGLLVSGVPARAVLLGQGDGARNQSPPREVPQLGHVVSNSGFGAILLGSGWVLTARHVSAGRVRVGTRFFDPAPGSAHEFRNPDGTLADLYAFRIEPPAEIRMSEGGPIEIASRPPERGALAYLSGNGANRGSALEWSMGVLGTRRGWHWGAGRAIRWGTNRIAGTGIDVRMEPYVSRGFSMVFGEPSGRRSTLHEAMVAKGDSGGAVFTVEDGRWVLSGVLVARTTHPGQPGDSAAYGNRILAVDLSHYRNEILGLMEGRVEPNAPISRPGAPAS